MNSIIDSIISELLENNKLVNTTSYQGIQIVKNEDGDVTITYKNPKNNPDYKAIKDYFNSIDDETMDQASNLLKKYNPEDYDVLSKMEDNDIDTVKSAVDSFKGYVRDIASDNIEQAQKFIAHMNKYLDK